LIERLGSGYWAVQFRDKVRNVFMGNLEPLPDDAPFEPSDAPLNATEKISAARLARIQSKGVEIGARVRILSDPTKCGIVEAEALAGRWAVRFSDRVVNFYLHQLEAVPDSAPSHFLLQGAPGASAPSHALLQGAPPAAFSPSTAPLTKDEERRERMFRKRRGDHADDDDDSYARGFAAARGIFEVHNGPKKAKVQYVRKAPPPTLAKGPFRPDLFTHNSKPLPPSRIDAALPKTSQKREGSFLSRSGVSRKPALRNGESTLEAVLCTSERELRLSGVRPVDVPRSASRTFVGPLGGRGCACNSTTTRRSAAL
jgi:hypothetical protein